MIDVDKRYITFNDPLAEQICITNYANGEQGITPELAATISAGDGFYENFSGTDIVNADWFKYFTSMTELNQQYSPCFKNCTKLESITFPDSMQNIGVRWQNDNNVAFYNCSKLQTVIFSKNLKEILRAFKNCSSLKNVDFSRCQGNPIHITEGSFANCNISNLQFPENLSILENDAFANNPLTSVIIPANTTEMGTLTFNGCSNLQEIIIEDGDVPFTLKGNNYYNGYGLGKYFSDHTVTLSSRTTKIETRSIDQSVTTLIVKADTPPTLDGDLQYGNSKQLSHIYVPSESVDLYKNATNWSNYSSIIDAIQ